MPEIDRPPPSYSPQQPSQPAQSTQAVRSSSTPYNPAKPSQPAQAVQPVDVRPPFDWVDVADCALNHQFALPKNALEELALDFRVKFLNQSPDAVRALKLIVLGAKAAREDERAKASEALIEVVRGARAIGARNAAAAKSIKADQRRDEILADYDAWVGARTAKRSRVAHGQKTRDQREFAKQRRIGFSTVRKLLADRAAAKIGSDC